MSEKKMFWVEMDHRFLMDHPEVLEQLSQLYCQTWMFDEHFGEYRVCPDCGRYFNHQQVELDGVVACDRCGIPLVEAWDKAKVAEEILMQAEGDFFGVLLVRGDKVIGFAWGQEISLDHVRGTWGDTIVDQLSARTKFDRVMYFDEIAVDRPYRGKGYGKLLAKVVCEWMMRSRPQYMGLLRTHQDSPARGIYEDLSYSIFAEDTEHGGGRVMMWVDRCDSITPNALKNVPDL